MSRRILTICLLVPATLAALVLAPGASAAKRSGPAPVITKVAPMRVSVGATLTIRGRHFRSRAKRNTVIFRGSGGRSAFVKPRRASRRKLVLRVSPAVARLLTVRNSSQRPTRLRLRVLAGKFSKFTSRRLSPVVVGVSGGGGGDGDGPAAVVCDRDSDHDNDLLSNSLEKQIDTDPCLEDTDKDGMIDGWEYYAAKDLNIKAVPYPGKRPFPNALDPSDGRVGSTGYSRWDFDGDGLTTYEENRAWRRTGSAFNAAAVGGTDLNSPLGYSDGTKFSRSGETPAVPAWRGPSYGVPAPPAAFPGTFNLHGDGAWRDDERDADQDGLSNWLESERGPRQNSWWQGFWSSRSVQPWPDTYYGWFDERPFADLDLADGDVDGDTLLDGEDDQDNDDWSNVSELYEVVYDLDGDGNAGGPTVDIAGTSYFVNAMNPCAPAESSRTCHDYKPF